MFNLNILTTTDKEKEWQPNFTKVYYLGLLHLIRSSTGMSPTPAVLQLYCRLTGIKYEKDSNLLTQLHDELITFFNKCVQDKIQKCCELLTIEENSEIIIPMNIYDDIERIKSHKIGKINTPLLSTDIKTLIGNINTTPYHKCEQLNYDLWRSGVYDYKRRRNMSADIFIPAEEFLKDIDVMKSILNTFNDHYDVKQTTQLTCDLLESLIRITLPRWKQQTDIVALVTRHKESIYFRGITANCIRDPYLPICLNDETPNINFVNSKRKVARIATDEFYYKLYILYIRQKKMNNREKMSENEPKFKCVSN